jgi:hypothetical protein
MTNNIIVRTDEDYLRAHIILLDHNSNTNTSRRRANKNKSRRIEDKFQRATHQQQRQAAQTGVTPTSPNAPPRRFRSGHPLPSIAPLPEPPFPLGFIGPDVARTYCHIGT